MFFVFLIFTSSKLHFKSSEERQFVQWMKTYNKIYVGEEYYFRLGIFLTNLRYCLDFKGQQRKLYRIELNKFSCHTPSEYRLLLNDPKIMNEQRINYEKTKPQITKYAPIPDSFDWRDKNVVNPIKDQGNCNSDWAFSVIATAESGYAIGTGNLYSLSVQNLIDCCNTCYGCNGGTPNTAFYWLMSNQEGYLNLESDYPYTAVQSGCKYIKEKSIHAVNYVYNTVKSDENDLKERLYKYGVASAVIVARDTSFMLYSGGIYDDENCEKELDFHAVAVVGYGIENSVDYWIVRNSWGENGYIRMIRNKNNQCFIAGYCFILAYIPHEKT